MSSSTGTVGAGTVFSSSTTSAGTYTPIAQVGDIKGPDVKGDDINITNQDSVTNAGGFKEFIPGLVDGGEVSLDLIFKKDAAAMLYGWFRQSRFFKIQYPDGTSPTTGSVWAFGGYINGFSPESPVDDKIMVTAKFKVSGAPSFTAAT